MTTQDQWKEEMEIAALRASRNLHRHFVKYLMGYIAWQEFLDICRVREKEFERRIRVKKED